MSTVIHQQFSELGKQIWTFNTSINACACVMYIASYVLKAEKGMGELLKQAAKELQQGNTRQQLNKLGSVFLTN